MTTPFKLLCDRCGLSQREAADFLGARLDTVKSWASGRNRAPAGVIAELRKLHATIERAAGELVAEVKKRRPDELALFLARTDDEARDRGWPCIGAMAAAIGIVAARTDLPVVMMDDPPPKAH